MSDYCGDDESNEETMKDSNKTQMPKEVQTPQTIKPKDYKKLEELMKDGTFKIGDKLVLLKYKLYNRNYLVDVRKDNETKHIVSNTFLRDVINSIGDGKKTISVFIGMPSYNETSKRKEHKIMCDKEK